MANTCPICPAKRPHTPDEIRLYHPLTGHGFSPETGWTHPDAKTAHDADTAAAALRMQQIEQAKAERKLRVNAPGH